MTTGLFPAPYKSPYEKIELDDDIDDAEQKSNIAKRQGLFYFLVCNLTIVLATTIGLACVVMVILSTLWLSRQRPECPDWSLDCTVSGRVKFLYRNFGAVQGVVTAVYSIGLAALAFSAHLFSESAFWPILHKQGLSIGQMDTYLEASRGSIISTLSTLTMTRSMNSALVILCSTIITFTPLAAAPLVGHVYNRAPMSVQYYGELQKGGGIGVFYTQSNPPGPVRDSASALYTSWQRLLSSEPLPDHRHWFINRNLMSKRGNFTVQAVRVQQDISCSGWAATPNKQWTSWEGFEREYFMSFNTSMPIRKNSKGKARKGVYQHDKTVDVRESRQLATWVHNYTFDNANKTTATLIFAAIGGNITGGTTTKIKLDKAKNRYLTSIACNVSVELMEDTLAVGDAPPPALSINPMYNINIIGSPGKGNPKASRKMNELALWFAVAPVANGVSVYGTQPMYTFKQDWIPERYTSTDGRDNNGWTIDYIKNFIHVSTGASMLGEVDKWGMEDPKTKKPLQARFPSYVAIVKMDPRRPILLVILPAIIIACGICLAVWNVAAHKSMALPIMRKATLSEVIKSSQTADVMGPAATEKHQVNQRSGLGKLKLRYSIGDNGVWGLHRI